MIVSCGGAAGGARAVEHLRLVIADLMAEAPVTTRAEADFALVKVGLTASSLERQAQSKGEN